MKMKKMKINNTITKRVIAQSSRMADFPLSRSLGLMFSKPKEEALILRSDKEEFINLHTIFVFYPIDVLVLDQDKKIIEIKNNFKPFTFWNSQRKGKYLVEIPSPTNHNLGDRFNLDHFQEDLKDREK